MKHTPGKWMWDVMPCELVSDCDEPEGRLRSILTCHIDHGPSEANARLIAKAYLIPKMVERLARYMDILDETMRHIGSDSKKIKEFQVGTEALIKEIEGE